VPTPAYPQSVPVAPQQQQQQQQVYGGPQMGQMPRPGNQFEVNSNLGYNPGGAPGKYLHFLLIIVLFYV